MRPFKLNTATTKAWKCRGANLLNLLKFEKNVGHENGIPRAKKIDRRSRCLRPLV